jgi:UDP-N-acetylmuramoyl-tripeptide--D-alanyl-D-alanine ligase
MAILGVTSALGLDPALILKRLETWPCPKGRGSPQTLSWSGRSITLIDDSYNANPLSMSAALKVLGTYSGRRVAVLGDMGELGKYTERAHQELAAPLNKMNISVLVAVGPHMALLAERVASQMEVATADDWTAAFNKLDDLCQDGDVILLKGSRRMMLDRVADAIVAAHH